MMDYLLKDPVSLLLVAFALLFFWYWLHWWLVSTAVKKGVSDMTNLMKKCIDPLGIPKKISKAHKIDHPEFPLYQRTSHLCAPPLADLHSFCSAHF